MSKLKQLREAAEKYEHWFVDRHTIIKLLGALDAAEAALIESPTPDFRGLRDEALAKIAALKGES